MASYYLNGVALYWHQNFMKGVGNERVTWGDYLEALCARFGGQKDPLKELMALRQVGNLETLMFYGIELTFQINKHWYFFVGGLEVEIKNLMKMFVPKTLKEAYHLDHLQENTLSYRCNH